MCCQCMWLICQWCVCTVSCPKVAKKSINATSFKVINWNCVPAVCCIGHTAEKLWSCMNEALRHKSKVLYYVLLILSIPFVVIVILSVSHLLRLTASLLQIPQTIIITQPDYYCEQLGAVWLLWLSLSLQYYGKHAVGCWSCSAHDRVSHVGSA